MAAANQSNIVYDALTSFELGVNSGLDPFLVPATQLPFATNATVSGNFVKARPPYFNMELDFSSNTDPTDSQTAFETGLFQGWCYYRPDTGPEQLVVSIGGRIFVITPRSTVGTGYVIEVTIPGDPNQFDRPQTWMYQAERWLVIQNGLNKAIFYDGVSCRRSLDEVGVVGTVTGADVSAPPIGQEVDINLTDPYTGIVGAVVNLVQLNGGTQPVNTNNYVVTAVNALVGTYTVTLKNLSANAGKTINPGSLAITQPANLGRVVAVDPYGTTSEKIVTFTGDIPPYVSSGKLPGTITGAQLLAGITGGSVDLFPYTDPNTVRMQNGTQYWISQVLKSPPPSRIIPGYVPPPVRQVIVGFITGAINVGETGILINNNQPNVTVGEIKSAFVTPAIGSTVDVQFTKAYTGGNQIVFIGEDQFQIVNHENSVPSNTKVTIKNLTDENNTVYKIKAGDLLYNLPEIPIGRMGAYCKNRSWIALGDGASFVAGDIVNGSSGSPVYNGRDAVLKMVENSLIAGGGSFRVPSSAGQITAMVPSATLDASLGQGPLLVVTPLGVFSCDAPYDRTTWQSTTNPILTQSLIGLGGQGQDSTIVVNGDLMFRAIDGIRSLIMARREFWSWGNTPISFEMNRVIQFDNTSGLPYCSAIQIDNRMLMTASPVQSPQGVYFKGAMVMNFDPISSLQGKAATVYDGYWTGLNIVRLAEGQFNGFHRAFAMCYSEINSRMEVYEILKNSLTYQMDNGDRSILWSFETPVLFKGAKNKGLFDLVSLQDGEVYIGDIKPGQAVVVKVQYRPDFSQCWFDWSSFELCNDGKSTLPAYGVRVGLGKPNGVACNDNNQTMSSFGRWFQLRFSIQGYCVFKMVRVAASLEPQTMFAKPICNV